MEDTRTFKLVKFSPIGFKVPNYPVQYCLLCRGYLTDVCSNCMETSNENCSIINKDGLYYHNHCFTFVNSNNTAKSKPSKNYSSSDEDDSD